MPRPVNNDGALRSFEEASGSLEERICAALAKLALAARHDYRRRASAEGLSVIQAQALSLLAREGPVEIGRLASRLALTPATVSDSVAALERRGLVGRKPGAGDRRRVRVEATARGKRLGASMMLWPEIFQGAVGGLDEAEKAVLFRVLAKMILTLLERGTIQQARICFTCAYFRPNVHENADRPHHCALVDVPLGFASFRLDCPDHEAGLSAAGALAELDGWLRVAR